MVVVKEKHPDVLKVSNTKTDAVYSEELMCRQKYSCASVGTQWQ